MTVVKLNNKPNNGFSLLDNFLNDIPTMFNGDMGTNSKTFVPVNIKETSEAYVLEVVAPGFEKNDFALNLEKNILTVSGEKKNEVKDDASAQGEKEIRREYIHRSFKRVFTLDEKIDGERIEAKYVNGVLTLNLPKKAEVKASRKEISVQ